MRKGNLGRGLALGLVMTMVLSLWPMQVYATEGTEGESAAVLEDGGEPGRAELPPPGAEVEGGQAGVETAEYGDAGSGSPEQGTEAEEAVDGTAGASSSDTGENADSEPELDYILGRPMTEEEITEQKSLVPELHDISIPGAEDAVNRSGQPYRATRIALPTYYDSRDEGLITQVKDQNPWNTCWAFSAISLMETAAIKAGLADNSADYSESHFAYFFYHRISNPLGNTMGDSNHTRENNFIDAGGNVWLSTHALASQVGAANENIAPYSEVSYSMALDDGIAYEDEVVLKNSYLLNDNEIEIKQAIMEYGAVSLSYNYQDQYYNAETAAYYSPELGVNHATVIVGWDDSYSRNNFIPDCQPASDGAWIVKNSWSKYWGDEGYFYLSYENSTLSNLTAFEVMPADVSDHVYEYDGSDSISSEGMYSGDSIANVFEVKGSETELLNKVQFSTYSDGLSYSIQIYTDLEDGGDPLSGYQELEEEITGYADIAGIYTVDVSKEISLEKGTKFSVVVTLQAEDGGMAYYGVERACDYDWYYCVAKIDQNQSFYRSSGQSSWMDLAEWQECARIKAFTKNAEKINIADAVISDIEMQNYTGEEIKPEVEVKYIGNILIKDTDYRVSYSNNVNCSSEALVIVKGIGNYSGKIQKTFTIRWNKSPMEITRITGGANKITVTWEDVPDETKYELYMAASKNGTYTKIATLAANETSYIKTGLSTAQTYYFKVRYYKNINGKNQYSDFSGIKYGTTCTSTPAIDTVTGGSGKATVKWKPVAGAKGYVLYMAASSGGTYTAKATINGQAASSGTVTGLSANKTYYFKVRAYRAGEGTNVYSGYSGVKSCFTAPSVPSIAKVTGGANKITLSWNDVNGESKYQVYMATSKNGEYQRVATLNANTTTYTKTGLNTAKNYYFKVRSYRASGNVTVYSSFSAIKYGTTSTVAPTIGSVTGGAKKATIKWNTVSGASGYVVYMSTSSSGTYSSIKTVDSKTTSLVKTGLSDAKNYYFKVRAYRNGEGVKVYSSYSTVKYCGTATATPSITKVSGGANKITVTWNNVSGETKYELYMASSKSGTYNKIAALNANTVSYTKSGLSTAKTYYFKVRTYRTVGGKNTYTGYSAVKYGTTSTAAPAISSVTGGAKQATVKWNAVSGANGYVVYMSGSASGAYSSVGTVSSQVTSLTKTGLAEAKNYYFKVRAYRNGDGVKVYSPYSAVKYSGTATAVPAISKAAGGNKKVSVSWKNVSGETKYQLYMAEGTSGKYSLAATLNANTTTYAKTGLKAGTKYFFKIRTYRTVNGKNIYSSFGAAVAATTAKEAVDTVYITPTGKCYHRASCSTLKNSKKVTAITRTEAEGKKLSACKVCKP